MLDAWGEPGHPVLVAVLLYDVLAFAGAVFGIVRDARSGFRASRWLALALCAAAGALFLTVAFRSLFVAARLATDVLFLVLPPLLAAEAFLAVWRKRRTSAALAAGGALLLASTYAYAFHVEPHRLEITHHEIRSPKITRPVRVAILADIQTDHIDDFEARAIRAALEERPDLVLFPGDYLQVWDAGVHTRESDRLRNLLRPATLTPSLGAFAIEGDCEARGWERLFDGTAVRALSDESVDLPDAGIHLVGISLAESRTGTGRLPALLAAAPPGRFVLVFGHAPEFALERHARTSADLCIAGHTHGGQVVLPFFGPPVTMTRIPRHIAAGGLHPAGNGWVYVSRGIGMERGVAPRLRFLCRPEVGIIDLLPSS
ncbi:MAG: hypothetical protein HY608_03910 [Planctomycetes bacterium]|nr:hypothetical protein [Planctomycetota bacterium]